MTTVKPSPGALSQHVAGTDGVWLTRQLSKHTLVLQVVFVRIHKRCRGLYHVGVMTWVFYVCICCGVCIYNTCSQTALCRCVYVCVCLCRCAHMVPARYEWRSLFCLSLRLWLWQPPCPPRSCCHMLTAFVRAELKPQPHRGLPLCGFGLLCVCLLYPPVHTFSLQSRLPPAGS